MLRSIILSLCLCLSFILVAQSTSPIIFIYDASGSMWGQMANKTKIQIAGKVLTEALDRLPSEQEAALVVYGHRQEGDCRDVEWLVKLDDANKTAVRAALVGVKPLGRTPLAYSAQLVLNELQTNDRSATVVLITDGIESCDGDLCATVQAAMDDGIDFRLHIIGFGLKEGETTALECAAKAGDGQYFDAANADALATSLTKATSETVDGPQELEEESMPANLTVYASRNGEAVDAVVRVKRAEISESPKLVRTYADTAKIGVPAGKYELDVRLVGSSDVTPIRKTIEVTEHTHQDISFDAGTLLVTTMVNGEAVDASVRILAIGTGKELGVTRTYGKPTTMEVTPGTYDVKLTAIKLKGAGQVHIINNVVIEAASETPISHNYETGTLEVKVTNNGEPWDAVVRMYDQTTDKQEHSGRTNEKSESAELTVGTYRISTKPMHIEGTALDREVRDIVVSAGSITQLEEDYESGELTVIVKHGGQPITALVKIVDMATGKQVESFRTKAGDTPAMRRLLAGEYEIRIKGLRDLADRTVNLPLSVVSGREMRREVEW